MVGENCHRPPDTQLSPSFSTSCCWAWRTFLRLDCYSFYGGMLEHSFLYPALLIVWWEHFIRFDWLSKWGKPPAGWLEGPDLGFP